ncbi:hypothetical protein OEZ86_007684 [Tetradesmus obliquus]|nr:hypothetical protein OEZ86_007684 [Tetradesmus obliquus]
MTWEPVSSLRGDATLDRFQLPKANILTTESGAITRMLDSKFTRRMIHPPYEALKETYSTSSEPQCMQQQRQRHAAAAEFEQQVQQRRAQEEAQERQRKADLLAGLLQRPEYMTSDDNPLADYESQAQQQQQQPPQQQWQLGSVVMAAAGYVNEEAMRLKEQMIDLYPHGAPRSVVNEAKAQGVTLPSLGHASLLPPVPRRSFNKRW